MGKKALGKGLDALINDESEIKESEIAEIDIEKIVPNRDQPRKSFDKQEIQELAESIRENGIIQPIVLRAKDEVYEIVVGERRFRAAKEAGLKKVPAIIKEYSESRLLEIALIENIQRKDLNPLEEALAFKTIIDRDTITQEELSKRVGRSRSYIANMIRLLELPDEIKKFVSRGTITVGHAKAIMALNEKEKQVEIAKKVAEEGLSVRETEDLVREVNASQNDFVNVPRGTANDSKEMMTAQGEKSIYIKELEEKLISTLGTRVKIRYSRGKGAIIINFFSDEELDRLLEDLL
ncbi:MAG: chromosome partitioning protein ParB [Spirochaetes bacterium]|nr:MAG: chromosome partitioning protein ParB [Spirochaetota bacterium]